MHKVLFALPRDVFQACFDRGDIDRLKGLVQVIPADPAAELPETVGSDWLSARLDDVDMMVTGWGTCSLDDRLIARSTRLRAIVHSAGSVKALIPQAAFDRGIAVTSCRHALALGVAETTLGMIIASAKLFWVYRDHLAAGGAWRDPSIDRKVLELYDVTVGVVAASEVGKQLLRLLSSFQVHRLVYDPYVDEDAIRRLGAEKTSLDDLLQRSDFVTVCAPSTAETHHMIGQRQLAMMKDHARLINTARGAIVDEQALIGELKKGRLFACIDVTDPEPPSLDNSLRKLPNVLLTPHVAGHISNGRKRQGKLAVDEIINFVNTGSFAWQITVDRLAQLA